MFFAYFDDLDLLKVLGPPDFEGGGVEGVAGDEVICINQSEQYATLTPLSFVSINHVSHGCIFQEFEQPGKHGGIKPVVFSCQRCNSGW